MDHSIDRVLRTVQVYSFIVGLCLLVPYGVCSGMVTLPLGCIPLFLSAIIGLIGLGNGLRKKCVAIPFDALLLAFHLGVFIPGVLFLSQSYGWRSQPGTVMLGTYATLPLMADICIHAYCIIRHLPIPGIGAVATCPNCQHEQVIRPHFHFSHPSVGFPPSTIFTPEDDDASEAPGISHYDDMTVGRPSSDLDGATIIGEPRLNQPLLAENKTQGRLV